MKTYQKLFLYPLGSIIAESFLRDQLIKNKNGMGGHLDELEPGMIANPFVNKIYVPAWGDGDQSGWGAEISGNYWSGLIQLAYSLHDEKLIKKVTDWVNKVLKKQKKDGYLGTYYEDDAKIYDDYNAWGTAGMLRGLLFFYEATKREDVLIAVHKCLLWFCDKWKGDKKTSYAGAYIIEPLILCYHITKDDKLVKFAEEYAEFLCRKDIFSISYKSFLKGLQFNSEHTAGMGVNSRLPALIYTATGNKEYLKSSIKILDEVYKKATHLSGSPVSINEYLAPVSSTAETEYCSYAFYNATHLYMSCITGESKYGDRAEEMFYNGAQGARKKDEKAIAYLNSPNQIYATENSSSAYNNMQVYAPCYPTACCPVNSVALLGEFVKGMILHDEKGNVYLNNYGPCTLKYKNIEIKEITEYPFKNTVKIVIEKGGEFSVNFRIPKWGKNYKITVNGKDYNNAKIKRGYLEVKEKWKTKSEIIITFAFQTEVLRVNDKYSSKKYPIAIKRGPLLYSLPIKEIWTPIKGSPNTPLPDGWNWFNVNPYFIESNDPDPHNVLGLRRNQIYWNVALDEKLNPEDIIVEERDISGYVWENPMICLKVMAYKAPYLCAPYPQRTFEPFEDRQKVTDKLNIELVPYGCTNLRITYFPRADLRIPKKIRNEKA